MVQCIFKCKAVKMSLYITAICADARFTPGKGFNQLNVVVKLSATSGYVLPLGRSRRRRISCGRIQAYHVCPSASVPLRVYLIVIMMSCVN